MNMAVSMREPWKPSDGDSKCQKCFGPNPIWYCDKAIWNQVMTGEATTEGGGILCPTCFMVRAESAGLREHPLSPLWEVCRRWPDDLSQQEYHALQMLRQDRANGENA